MASELGGQVSSLPGGGGTFARTLVNRAWLQVQTEFVWSFLWGDCAIPTPSPIQTGTVTVVPGTATITADAAASAAWTGLGLVNPLTTRQFRVDQGTIYNIIAASFTVPTAVVLTLDRAFVDPVTSNTGVGYQILGVYFNAPTRDFMWWESIRDPISGYTLGTTRTREEIDDMDPQRFQSGWPEEVLPYLVNPWPGNFNQFPMYEIWPAPLNNYTYVGTYFRAGTAFTLPTDTVAVPLGEDIVLEKAKEYAYEWGAANPDKAPKADYKFLIAKCSKTYQGMLNRYMLKDEEFSHRTKINRPRVSDYQRLPWVSQRVMLMVAP